MRYGYAGLVLVMLFALIIASASAEAWLSGYEMRRQINLTGEPGAGTGYQVRLAVGKNSSAVDVNFDLDDEVSDFPNDIRFTDDDGDTLLDYWNESYSSTKAVFWVEVQDNLDSDQYIYVYYGKTGEVSESNPYTTFPVFDNFESIAVGNPPNTSKWYTYGTNPTNTITIVTDPAGGTNKVARVYETADAINTGFGLKDITPGDYAYEFRARFNMGRVFYFSTYINSSDGAVRTATNNPTLITLDAANKFQYYTTIYNTFSGIPAVSADVWYDVGERVDDYNMTFEFLNVNYTGALRTSSNILSTSSIAMQPLRMALPNPVLLFIDDFKVRKFNYPEPRFSSAGQPSTMPPPDYNVIITVQAQQGHFYDDFGFASYRSRTVLGQRFIGTGFDDSSDRRVQLGYLYMLNSKPVINGTAINAHKIAVVHPYTNDSLACEMNITDKDVGDRLTLSVKWYKNSSNWYNNNETVNNSNIEDQVDEYNVSFEEWPSDLEEINHTLVAGTTYITNTTPYNATYYTSDSRSGDGSIEPVDTKHYDIWKCSVDVFDGVSHSGWLNSTPFFVFNHNPDYNSGMPMYYAWPEDTAYYIDLGSNFSDIDYDDIDWYINWTSEFGPGMFGIEHITITIDNSSGIVTLTPSGNITGVFDIIFTGVDNNQSYTTDRYLRNDIGQTNTNTLRMNVTQVNDPPWPSAVYIHSPQPAYQDMLTCMYTYNDIEDFPENSSAASFIWWHQDEGLGIWVDLGVNQSTLSPSHFDLDDKIICSIKIKDIYTDWNGVDMSLWSIPPYTNSTSVTIGVEPEEPIGGGEIIIGQG